MLLTAVFLQISKSALQQIMFVTALKMDNLDCTKIKCTFQKFHSLSTGGAFSRVVSCPDPRGKGVWLQYDILPDPVTKPVWHVG